MRQASAILVLTSACVAAAEPACAAEWSAAPLLSASVSHDTNQTLNEDAKAGEAGYVRMELLMKHATPGTAFVLRPQVTLQRFTVDEMSQAEDESVLAAGTWTTPQSVYSASASVTHQNTLNNVLVESDLVGIDTRRRSKLGSFSWTHNQSRDRHQLYIGLNYTDVDYQGSDAYRLSAYRYPLLQITQTIGWSPRSSLLLTAYGSRLDSDARMESDSNGAQIGFTYELTPHIGMKLTGGYSQQKVKRRYGPFTLNSRDSGYTGEFELTRQDLMGQWRLSAGRSVTASGFGVLVARTQALLAFDRRFAERWTANVSLRHIDNDDIGDVSSGEVRSYQRFDAGVSWRVTRTWTVGAAAFANRLQRQENSPLAEGWGGIVSATWTPRARTLSR